MKYTMQCDYMVRREQNFLRFGYVNNISINYSLKQNKKAGSRDTIIIHCDHSS
jgi:hypothetical protein